MHRSGYLSPELSTIPHFYLMLNHNGLVSKIKIGLSWKVEPLIIKAYSDTCLKNIHKLFTL